MQKQKIEICWLHDAPTCIAIFWKTIKVGQGHAFDQTCSREHSLHNKQNSTENKPTVQKLEQGKVSALQKYVALDYLSILFSKMTKSFWCFENKRSQTILPPGCADSQQTQAVHRWGTQAERIFLRQPLISSHQWTACAANLVDCPPIRWYGVGQLLDRRVANLVVLLLSIAIRCALLSSQ